MVSRVLVVHSLDLGLYSAGFGRFGQFWAMMSHAKWKQAKVPGSQSSHVKKRWQIEGLGLNLIPRGRVCPTGILWVRDWPRSRLGGTTVGYVRLCSSYYNLTSFPHFQFLVNYSPLRSSRNHPFLLKCYNRGRSENLTKTCSVCCSQNLNHSSPLSYIHITLLHAQYIVL
jgi:hypothetical protein